MSGEWEVVLQKKIPSGAEFMATLGFPQLPVVACTPLGKRLQPGASGCCSSVDSCRGLGRGGCFHLIFLGFIK